ncbi:unnamed protein product [Nesidiocoris tenuis]|uniref:Integrase catalytic domain-containing protein n=1 Tax=Nesidiocoris tenuis TaxID=355587 RepID=A0A6H5GPC7_9HEMI|nr:unnamed protein product [Nesidiocoris tenuis]
MSSNDDVRDHVSSFFDTVDKLLDMEIKINDDLLTIMLLYSLPEEFENFRCAIESRDDLPKPETLRTKIIEEADARKNNGSEFVNKKFDAYLKDCGIARRLSVPHTPQQNGLAERMNRTIMNMVRCFLIESQLPVSFWAEAASTAVYIKNRCPAAGINGKIPYKQWYKKTPTAVYFRRFGSKGFMQNKPAKSKLEPKSVEVILVGYSTTSKAYRVWCPSERKTYVARDIQFIKEEPIGKYREAIPKDFFEDQWFDVEITNEQNSTTERRRIEPEQPEQTIEDHAEEADDWEEDEETEEINADTRGNCESPEPSMVGNRMKRGRGRPRLLRTGSRGRPRKIYTMVPENEEIAGVVEISVKQALSSAQSDEWRAAIRKEFNSLLQNGTWVMEKRPKDKNVVGCRLILCNKFKANGELDRRKARLVARGFTQEYGVDYNETYAPVSRLSSLHMIMALAVQHDMEIIQMDVETAYLNGELEETIFMEAPECLEEILNDIVKEEKGKIKDSAEKMLKHLQTGKTVCRLKKSLYGLKQSGRQWYKKLDEKLKQLGMETTSADPCVYILDKVNYLSQFNTKYDEATWKAAKHVLQYLKGTEDLKLVFKNDGKPLTGYVDSDWGNCPNDRRSYSGCLFNMSGSAISWMARKQRTVALSSTEAEYLGLSEAAKEAVYLKNFLTSVGFPPRDRIRIYNDNQGALQLVKNPTYHARTKHIDVRQQFIRQVTERE